MKDNDRFIIIIIIIAIIITMNFVYNIISIKVFLFIFLLSLTFSLVDVYYHIINTQQIYVFTCASKFVLFFLTRKLLCTRIHVFCCLRKILVWKKVKMENKVLLSFKKKVSSSHRLSKKYSVKFIISLETIQEKNNKIGKKICSSNSLRRTYFVVSWINFSLFLHVSQRFVVELCVFVCHSI